MIDHATLQPQPALWVQFWHLTKPRVVSLIVFTAVIGMLLAAPALPPARPARRGDVGIALVAGAAAAFNCLVEQKIDAVMARTRGAPHGDGHDHARRRSCSSPAPSAAWGSRSSGTR